MVSVDVKHHVYLLTTLYKVSWLLSPRSKSGLNSQKDDCPTFAELSLKMTNPNTDTHTHSHACTHLGMHTLVHMHTCMHARAQRVRERERERETGIVQTDGDEGQCCLIENCCSTLSHGRDCDLDLVGGKPGH